MIYNICTIADIHWNATSVERLYSELQIFTEFIKSKKDLNLIVIAGDYFDDKISLNSKAAYYSVKFMQDIYTICKERDIKIRIIMGTLNHDNKQLHIFQSQLDIDDSVLKIITKTEREETLPGLHCLYCPDETVSTQDWYLNNVNILLNKNPLNIGFFHGSFDIILPNIVLQESEIESINNVIYEYHFLNTIINGPIIAGHFHDATTNDKLYYVGSYTRWAFNEENPKGFLFTSYNTNTNQYYCKRIENFYAPKYDTISIDIGGSLSLEDYQKIINHIQHRLDTENENNRYRIKIFSYEDTPSDENIIELIRHTFLNEKRVKIVINNKKKIKEKKQKRAENNFQLEKYNYLYEKSMTMAEKLQKFISDEYGKSIPIENINEYIGNYMEEVTRKITSSVINENN